MAEGLGILISDEISKMPVKTSEFFICYSFVIIFV